MIIEFPKRYDVKMHLSNSGAIVTMPAEYTTALIELLNQQPWVVRANPLYESISV